jgi:hypothetical protein
MRNVYIRDEYWDIRTTFGKIRTPFGKMRTLFGKIRTPLGKIRTPFGKIRTPFGKMRTLFFRPKAWDFLRGLLGDTPGYWRKHERGAGLVQGLQQSVHLTNG